MTGCVFCRIAEGSLPSHRVYEDPRVVAFLDAAPAAAGHTLVIPRVHVARVEDLTQEDAEALFGAVHRLVKPVREAVVAQAATIGVNDGPGSGQEIPHVHVHIIPRNPRDGLGIIQRVGARMSQQQLAETAEKIRSLLCSSE